MRNVLMAQIKLNLKTFEKQDWRIRLALKQVEKIEAIDKEEDMSSIINSPAYQNIVHILGPLAIYYKIDQVLKLLKEMGIETSKPSSPYYIVPQPMK